MRYLTREQRYTISAMYRQGCTQKMIAQAIGKDKSVVSRELKRNRNEKGKYTFSYAQDMAEIRKERSRQPRKLKPGLKRQILQLLEQYWSPQQIEGRLKLRGEPYVSHETIYKIIRSDEDEKIQFTDIERRFLTKTVDFIYLLLDKRQLDVNTLAEKLCMSPRQFHRKIVALTGKPPASYILEMKMQKARHLLESKLELTIEDIADRCGFEHVSSFYHAFKKIYGITPTEHRKRASS